MRLPLIAILLVYGPLYGAQSKTLVKDEAAKQSLLKVKRLSLQWISFGKQTGPASVTEKAGVLHLKGEQRGKDGNYVTVEGVITEVMPKAFRFKGTVVTRVDFLNSGKPCKRDGEMTFSIKGNRKYWRLYPVESPCDDAADYVDIYLP